MDPTPLEVSQASQLAVVIAAFGIKPAYMLLSLFLIGILWRQRSTDLRLIRWSLWSFLIGEGFCAIDFFACPTGQDWLEILHQLGMIGFGTLLPWGLFVMLDQRLLGLSDPDKKCLAQRFCGRCWKRDRVGCGLWRLMIFAVLALALVSILPWCAAVEPQHLLIPILGEPVHYSLSADLQWAMFRIYPGLAAMGYLAAFALLLLGRRGIRLAQLPFFVALGFSTFAWLRFFLRRAFWTDPPWADSWEEITELLGVAAVAALLWSFRGPLGLSRAAGRPDEGADDGHA